MDYILLPAYNEEAAIPGIGIWLEKLSAPDRNIRVIFVNDGSRDDTAAELAKLAKTFSYVHVIEHTENRGLGEAIKTGLSFLRDCDDLETFAILDCDLTHDLAQLEEMWRLVSQGNDVVICSRYQPGSIVRGVSPLRKLLSYGVLVLFKIFFHVRNVRDYSCGFRCYNRRALQQLFDKNRDIRLISTGFSIMVEIILVLRKNPDIRFAEMPMVLRYDKKQGASKIRIVKTIGEYMKVGFNHALPCLKWRNR